MRLLRWPPVLLVLVVALAGLGTIAYLSMRPSLTAAVASPHPSGAPSASEQPSPTPGTPSPSAPPSPSPSVSPSPTPAATPTLVADALTGRLVTPAVARQHVIAVMIDDQHDARPQSGLASASVVWQAPAEGGIPRYMVLFQDRIPGSVGPVRSSRYYFIAWAAEWRSVYVHAGGSPQALSTLRAGGNGQLVYNADYFRWGGTYLWRISQRIAPHNVYTDGGNLRALSRAVHAPDVAIKPAWKFGPDTLPWNRPIGGRISVAYLYNKITYRYDNVSNTYVRSVSGFSPQVDAADRRTVAPKNVIVMLMRFGPLNDGHPEKARLEAQVVGSGTAWISSNGRTIKGTWRKKGLTAPTQFFDSKGRLVTLAVGQTFIQVLPYGSPVSFVAGATPPPLRGSDPLAGGSSWPIMEPQQI